MRRSPHPDDHGSHRYVPEGPPPAPVPFPGPRGVSALRTINQIRLNPLPVLAPLQRKWGDRIGVSVGGYRYVLLYHPSDIEAMLVGGTHSTMKAYALRQGRWMMGGQLLVAEGEMHACQRKVLAPAFASRRIESYVDTVAEQSIACVERLHDGGRFEAETLMGDLDLAISGRTMFGGRVEGEEAEQVAKALETSVYAFPITMHPMRTVIEKLRIPPIGAVMRSRRLLNRTVKRLIEDGRERLRRGEDHGDVLSILVKNYCTDDMSEEDYDLVIDEARGLLLGGHETLARSLAWGLQMLAEHPEIAERIRAQTIDLCGDGPIGPEHVEQLDEAFRAFQETIRLYPAGGLHVRETQEPVRLDDDTTLDAGLQIAIPVWTVHRDPRWWKEPETFNPDRFREVDPDRPRWAYNPWGGGTRVCIGQAYATMFGTVLIATICRRWRLEVAPDSRAEPVSIFTVRSRHGLPLIAREWDA